MTRKIHQCLHIDKKETEEKVVQSAGALTHWVPGCTTLCVCWCPWQRRNASSWKSIRNTLSKCNPTSSLFSWWSFLSVRTAFLPSCATACVSRAERFAFWTRNERETREICGWIRHVTYRVTGKIVSMIRVNVIPVYPVYTIMFSFSQDHVLPNGPQRLCHDR